MEAGLTTMNLVAEGTILPGLMPLFTAEAVPTEPKLPCGSELDHDESGVESAVLPGFMPLFTAEAVPTESKYRVGADLTAKI